MFKTISRDFASSTQAQSVKGELVKQGYLASDIGVAAQEQQLTAANRASSSGASSTDTGLGTTISHFFRSLTGSDDEEQSEADVVREGRVRLSVRVQEEGECGLIRLLESLGGRAVQGPQDGLMSDGGKPSSSLSSEVSATTSIPIVQEELTVGKRQVQRGGIRLHSRLVETPVEENVRLREEYVNIERKNVNRPALGTELSAFQEGTIEFTETVEAAVISKTAHVIEQITISKVVSERTQTVREIIRHTEVEIEQLGTTEPAADRHGLLQPIS